MSNDNIYYDDTVIEDVIDLIEQCKNLINNANNELSSAYNNLHANLRVGTKRIEVGQVKKEYDKCYDIIDSMTKMVQDIGATTGEFNLTDTIPSLIGNLRNTVGSVIGESSNLKFNDNSIQSYDMEKISEFMSTIDSNETVSDEDRQKLKQLYELGLYDGIFAYISLQEKNTELETVDAQIDELASEQSSLVTKINLNGGSLVAGMPEEQKRIIELSEQIKGLNSYKSSLEKQQKELEFEYELWTYEIYKTEDVDVNSITSALEDGYEARINQIKTDYYSPEDFDLDIILLFPLQNANGNMLECCNWAWNYYNANSDDKISKEAYADILKLNGATRDAFVSMDDKSYSKYLELKTISPDLAYQYLQTWHEKYEIEEGQFDYDIGDYSEDSVAEFIESLELNYDISDEDKNILRHNFELGIGYYDGIISFMKMQEFESLNQNISVLKEEKAAKEGELRSLQLRGASEDEINKVQIEIEQLDKDIEASERLNFYYYAEKQNYKQSEFTEYFNRDPEEYANANQICHERIEEMVDNYEINPDNLWTLQYGGTIELGEITDSEAGVNFNWLEFYFMMAEKNGMTPEQMIETGWISWKYASYAKALMFFTEEERNVYNLIFVEEGEERALEFLESRMDGLNDKGGKKIAIDIMRRIMSGELELNESTWNEIFGDTIDITWTQFCNGWDGSFENFVAFLTDNDLMTVTEYESLYILEFLNPAYYRPVTDEELAFYKQSEQLQTPEAERILAQGELRYYDILYINGEIDQESYEIYQGMTPKIEKSGSWLYNWGQAGQSAGNMASSVVISRINPVVGRIFLLLSSAGGTQKQATRAGYSLEVAKTYSVVTALVEVGFETVMGSIPYISWLNKGFDLSKFGGSFWKYAAAVSANFGFDLTSEVIEENLQAYVQVFIDWGMLHKPLDFTEVEDSAGETTIVTLMTTFLLHGGGIPQVFKIGGRGYQSFNSHNTSDRNNTSRQSPSFDGIGDQIIGSTSSNNGLDINRETNSSPDNYGNSSPTIYLQGEAATVYNDRIVEYVKNNGITELSVFIEQLYEELDSEYGGRGSFVMGKSDFELMVKSDVERVNRRNASKTRLETAMHKHAESHTSLSYLTCRILETVVTQLETKSKGSALSILTEYALNNGNIDNIPNIGLAGLFLKSFTPKTVTNFVNAVVTKMNNFGLTDASIVKLSEDTDMLGFVNFDLTQEQQREQLEASTSEALNQNQSNNIPEVDIESIPARLKLKQLVYDHINYNNGKSLEQFCRELRSILQNYTTEVNAISDIDLQNIVRSTMAEVQQGLTIQINEEVSIKMRESIEQYFNNKNGQTFEDFCASLYQKLEFDYLGRGFQISFGQFQEEVKYSLAIKQQELDASLTRADYYKQNKDVSGGIGIDQGLVRKLAGHPFQFNIEYNRLFELLKTKYHFDSMDSERVMKMIDTTGICTYATIATNIVSYFRFNSQLFEQVFGFSLYTTDSNGNRILNSTELLIDMYVFMNSDSVGGKIFQMVKGWQKIVGANSETSNDVLTGKQNYLSGATFINNALVNLYLKSKDQSFQFNSSILKARGENTEISIDKAKEYIIDNIGSYDINLDIDFFNSHTVVELNDIENPNNPPILCTSDKPGGHAVPVVGYNDKGVIVYTWGRAYLISWEDVASSAISIQAISVNATNLNPHTLNATPSYQKPLLSNLLQEKISQYDKQYGNGKMILALFRAVVSGDRRFIPESFGIRENLNPFSLSEIGNYLTSIGYDISNSIPVDMKYALLDIFLRVDQKYGVGETLNALIRGVENGNLASEAKLSTVLSRLSKYSMEELRAYLQSLKINVSTKTSTQNNSNVTLNNDNSTLTNLNQEQPLNQEVETLETESLESTKEENTNTENTTRQNVDFETMKLDLEKALAEHEAKYSQRYGSGIGIKALRELIKTGNYKYITSQNDAIKLVQKYTIPEIKLYLDSIDEKINELDPNNIDITGSDDNKTPNSLNQENQEVETLESNQAENSSTEGDNFSMLDGLRSRLRSFIPNYSDVLTQAQIDPINRLYRALELTEESLEQYETDLKQAERELSYHRGDKSYESIVNRATEIRDEAIIDIQRYKEKINRELASLQKEISTQNKFNDTNNVSGSTQSNINSNLELNVDDVSTTVEEIGINEDTTLNNQTEIIENLESSEVLEELEVNNNETENISEFLEGDMEVVPPNDSNQALNEVNNSDYVYSNELLLASLKGINKAHLTNLEYMRLSKAEKLQYISEATIEDIMLIHPNTFEIGNRKIDLKIIENQEYIFTKYLENDNAFGSYTGGWIEYISQNQEILNNLSNENLLLVLAKTSGNTNAIITVIENRVKSGNLVFDAYVNLQTVYGQIVNISEKAFEKLPYSLKQQIKLLATNMFKNRSEDLQYYLEIYLNYYGVNTHSFQYLNLISLINNNKIDTNLLSVLIDMGVNSNIYKYFNYEVLKNDLVKMFGVDYIKDIGKYGEMSSKLLYLFNNYKTLCESYAEIVNRYKQDNSFSNATLINKVCLDFFFANADVLKELDFSTLTSDNLINYILYQTFSYGYEGINDKISIDFSSDYQLKFALECDRIFEENIRLEDGINKAKNAFFQKYYSISLEEAIAITKRLSQNVDEIATYENGIEIKSFLGMMMDVIEITDADYLYSLYHSFFEQDTRFTSEEILYFDSLIKTYYAKSYVDALQKTKTNIESMNKSYATYNGKSVEIINLESDFSFFVYSSDTGYFGLKPLKNDSYVDTWHSINNPRASGLSSSYISESNIGSAPVNGNGVLYAFTNISTNQIGLMAPYDLHSNINDYVIDAKNKSVYLTAENMSNDTTRVYNEIILDRNGLTPDYIILYNDASVSMVSNALKAASEWGIPILRINRYNLAKKQMNKIMSYYETFVSSGDLSSLEKAISLYQSNTNGYKLNPDASSPSKIGISKDDAKVVEMLKTIFDPTTLENGIIDYINSLIDNQNQEKARELIMILETAKSKYEIANTEGGHDVTTTASLLNLDSMIEKIKTVLED